MDAPGDAARRFGKQALQAACCGALAALPWHVPPLFAFTWIALAAWIALTPRSPRAAFLQWLVGGTIFVSTALYWLPEAAALRLEVSYTGGLLAAATLILWDALRFGVFGYLVAWLRPLGYRSMIAWPIAWVALELVWPHVFPWRLGQTQLGWLPLCQIAEFTGVYGISFLLVWACAAAGLWLRTRLSIATEAADGFGWKGAAIAAASVAAAVGWGWWRMADIERSTSHAPRLRLALIQPGTAGEGMVESLHSQSLAIDGDVDLVVWGEGTAGEHPLSLMRFRCDTNTAGSGTPHHDEHPCPALNRPLLCGAISYVADASRSSPVRNTALLIDADGAVAGRYHKRVLMPWGEYAVGQDWIPGLRRLLGDIHDLAPGTSAAPLAIRGHGRLGVLICYEDLTAETARQTVREGGQVLINLNNLSTFGDTPAAVQHQRLATFRAIESRRWLVRCGTTGSTAVISATGREEHRAALRQSAVLIGSVPMLDHLTFYTRWGDLFAWACVALIAIWSCRSDFASTRS